MLKRILLIAFMLLSAFYTNAQSIIVEDFTNFYRLLLEDNTTHKYIFLDSFIEGETGRSIYARMEKVLSDYYGGRKLSYDPKILISSLERYAIGRRAWNNVLNLENGYSAVTADGKLWGVINIHGEITVPLQYGEVTHYNPSQKKLSMTKPGAQCGLLSYDGEILSEFKYNNVRIISGNSIAQFNDGDMVLLSSEGKEVSEKYYDIEDYYFDDGAGKSYVVLTARDKKKNHGVIDSKGNVIIPIKYRNSCVNDGRQFGKPERVYMYWCGLRSENGTLVQDYYDVRNLELVYTGLYE